MKWSKAAKGMARILSLKNSGTENSRSFYDIALNRSVVTYQRPGGKLARLAKVIRYYSSALPSELSCGTLCYPFHCREALHSQQPHSNRRDDCVACAKIIYLNPLFRDCPLDRNYTTMSKVLMCCVLESMSTTLSFSLKYLFEDTFLLGNKIAYKIIELVNIIGGSCFSWEVSFVSSCVRPIMSFFRCQ